MNGYKFTRIEDDTVEAELALAIGLDKEVPGLVMVDLILPKFKGGFRFTAWQFDMFTYAVTSAAKMANSMAMVVDCFNFCLDGEDEEVVKRALTKMGDYLADTARHNGGEEPHQRAEEELPFDEL